MKRDPAPKQCPKCSAKRDNTYGLRRSPMSWHWHCTACGWNDIPESRNVTKEEYQYYCRLTRLRFAPQQISPPRRKQPWHILTSVMYELYARDVPFWMRQHLESASLSYARHRSWYFEAFCKSRWEYHSMLESGFIQTPQAYQQFYVERREWEQDSSECEAFW